MNADRIVNMIINRITRVVVNKGVDFGLNSASNVAQKVRRPKKAQDDVYIDDHGNVVGQEPKNDR